MGQSKYANLLFTAEMAFPKNKHHPGWANKKNRQTCLPLTWSSQKARKPTRAQKKDTPTFCLPLKRPFHPPPPKPKTPPPQTQKKAAQEAIEAWLTTPLQKVNNFLGGLVENTCTTQKVLESRDPLPNSRQGGTLAKGDSFKPQSHSP